MSVTFDASRIAAFRDAQFSSDKSIATLDANGGIKANGTYSGPLSAIFRTSEDKASNNAVRTELLRSLGQAFGIGGMTETNGKVTFSKDFMDKLESILGKDVFKRGDFKIGADGTVTSGRPLTSRRISAIITKATAAAQGVSGELEMGTLGPIMEPDVPEVETVKTVGTTSTTGNAATGNTKGNAVGTTGSTAAVSSGGEFDANVYRAKLDIVKTEIAPLKEDGGALRLFDPDPDDQSPRVRGARSFQLLFDHVGQCLDFLDSDFEGLIVENEVWIENERSGKSNEGVARFVIRDPNTHEETPMPTAGVLENWLRENTSFRGVFHTNLNGFAPRALSSDHKDHNRINTPEDLTRLKNYVRTTTRFYVQTSIDLYFEAKAANKLNDYIGAIGRDAGGCMDARLSRIGEIRTELGLFADADVTQVAEHDSHTNLDKCIYEEIRVAYAKNPSAESWNDLAGDVKKALVGQVRPIGTLNSLGAFEPLVEDGKPVVRAITEADIDRIGQTCADIAGIF